MKRFTFKKVFNFWVFFLLASVFFSSFSHAAGGRRSPIPDRTNVSSTNYMIIMLTIGIAYSAFLLFRARRRRKHNEIFLKYSK
jgi:hypothetical protein